MEFEKLQTASLKELFISSVEDKILSGELPIGAQLPTERELAEMMDVSRGVVNSGIAEMAHKGFLEVRPRVGTFVADYRRVGKSDIFLSIMHYNGGILPEQEIRSLLEFKSLIDCFSVRKLTARAITEAEVQKLEDFVDQMAETDDPQRVSELAYAYNQELSFLSGNTFAPLIYNSFKTANVQLGARYVQRYGKASLYHYLQQLLVQLLNGDTARAVALVEAQRFVIGQGQGIGAACFYAKAESGGAGAVTDHTDALTGGQIAALDYPAFAGKFCFAGQQDQCRFCGTRQVQLQVFNNGHITL